MSNAPATAPATAEKKPPRVLSEGEQKTNDFKVHLQAIIKEVVGEKVSKETAWKLFKEIMTGTAQFVVNQEDKALSLSGVGKFTVIKAGARGKKKEEGLTYVPKFRFYPSSTTEAFVEAAMGQAPLPEDFKGIGIYNTEDAIDRLAALATANATWMAETPVTDTESEEG